ncbi:hypothetical protein ACP275_10G090600 [Erythranthe tilingii]
MQKSSESSLIMIGTTIPPVKIPSQSETEKSDPTTNLPESGDSSSDEKSKTQKSPGNQKRVEEDQKRATKKSVAGITTAVEEGGAGTGRERLKRHRVEVAGRVWIPDMWGQENLLKDWIDCTAFDASLVNSSITSARDSLVQEARRANSARLRIIQQN